jgi:inner membrane protein
LRQSLNAKNPAVSGLIWVRILRLAPRSLLGATVALALVDWVYRLAGDSVVPGGPLDETAHLLTTLIVLWALGRRVCDRFLIPALVASVAIDLDHIPAELGTDFLTRGTSRPYTHSLLSIVIVLVAAAWWRSRREVLLGIAIGLAIHFWRDTSENGTGVALAWPVSTHEFVLSHTGYLIVMGVFVCMAAVSCRSQARR